MKNKRKRLTINRRFQRIIDKSKHHQLQNYSHLSRKNGSPENNFSIRQLISQIIHDLFPNLSFLSLKKPRRIKRNLCPYRNGDDLGRTTQRENNQKNSEETSASTLFILLRNIRCKVSLRADITRYVLTKKRKKYTRSIYSAEDNTSRFLLLEEVIILTKCLSRIDLFYRRTVYLQSIS